MGFDLGGWLKRSLTLRKSQNSLSDILGSDQAALFRKRMEPLVSEVLEHALDFAGAGVYSAANLALNAADRFVQKAEEEIGKPLADKAKAEIERAIWDQVKSAANKRDALKAAIERGLWNWLKL
jgi:hypothetical protein